MFLRALPVLDTFTLWWCLLLLCCCRHQGKVEKEPEVLLIMKTQEHLLPTLTAKVGNFLFNCVHQQSAQHSAGVQHGGAL